ncbi:21358_t:CDS:1, partial [Gigaspora rosea]
VVAFFLSSWFRSLLCHSGGQCLLCCSSWFVVCRIGSGVFVIVASFW